MNDKQKIIQKLISSILGGLIIFASVVIVVIIIMGIYNIYTLIFGN